MAESISLGVWGVTSEDILKTQFPMHRACRDGDVETLAVLLNGTHNVYEEDSFYGWTPAHWAAYFGKLSCVMWLLEKGVHPDKATKKLKQTALHLSAFAGSSHCSKWLLHHGAKLDIQLGCLRKLMIGLDVNCSVQTSRFKQTPAHLAAFGGHPQCLLWLVQSGVQVELQDYLGETAIHKAARTGSMECVSLLASHGANLLVINNNGHSSSQVATMCGHDSCAKYLIQCAMQQESQGVVSVHAYRDPPGQTQAAQCDVTTGSVIPCVPIQSNVNTDSLPTNGHSNDMSNGFCDDEMECSDHATPVVNSAARSATDVTLDTRVSQNIVAVGGRKRSREEVHWMEHKRARTNDFSMDNGMEESPVFPNPNLNGTCMLKGNRKVHFDASPASAQDEYVAYDYNGIMEEDYEKAASISESCHAASAQKPARCAAFSLMGHYI